MSTPENHKDDADGFDPSLLNMPEPLDRREDSGLSDLTGSLVSAPTLGGGQDPPARILRTPSVEASASSSNSDGIVKAPFFPDTNKMLDPPSLVTKVLGIVDLSCVSSSGILMDDEINHPFRDLRQSLTFQPEWGVAPRPDTDMIVPSIDNGAKDIVTVSNNDTANYSASASHTKRTLAGVAARMTAENEAALHATTSPPRSNSTYKRHETFELVYKEPDLPTMPHAKATGRVSVWIANKLKVSPKNNVLRESLKGHDNQAFSPCSSPIDESVTGTMTPTKNMSSAVAVVERAISPDRLEASMLQLPPKAIDPSYVTPEKPPIEVEPVFEPAEFQSHQEEKFQKKNHWGILKALVAQKKKGEDDPFNSLSPIHSRAVSNSCIDGNAHHLEDVPLVEEPMQRKGIGSNQRRQRKTLKSIKSSIKALETVEEEADETGSHKVRVPGVQIPDSFISDRDLIGSEIVDEIYSSIDKAIAMEHQEQKSSESQRLTTTTILQESSQIVLETVPVSPIAGVKVSTAGYHEMHDCVPNPVQGAKSWTQRLGLTKFNPKSKQSRSDNLHSTSPMAIAPVAGISVESGTKKRKQKPQWRAALDPATGRTYYFHKKTRETTWTKPEDCDINSPEPDNSKEGQIKPSFENSNSTLSSKEIARMIEKHSPSDEPTVQKVGSRHDGREEEFVTQLNAMVVAESKPFDEPAQSFDHPEDEKKMVDEQLIRTRTGVSIYSGFSGKYSQKSRISELTQQIKNTSSSNPATTRFPDKTRSLATSISTKQDGLPTGLASSVANTKTKIPKNIPVPRLRELNVEEFTTSDRVYGERSLIRRKPVRTGVDSTTKALKHQPIESEQSSDYEDNDADKSTVSYAATDSISALSEADLSLVDRKDVTYDARRRALDRAIAQEDWDHVAHLSESIRKTCDGATDLRGKPREREWAQSEMDRFISDSDWEAMSAYIARLRANANEVGQIRMVKHLKRPNIDAHPDTQVNRGIRPSQSNNSDASGASNPQKRFGARSQLQHGHLNPTTTTDSYSSYSSTYDSEYTSESYEKESDEKHPPAPASRQSQPKAFAC